MTSTMTKLIFFFVSLWVAFYGETGQAKILEKIYAVVNGEIITLTEIADYQKRLRSGGMVDDLIFADPAVVEKSAKNRKYLIDRLIDEKIIDYEVKRNGFVVTADRINKEIETIASRKNLRVDDLKNALSHQGVDYVFYQDFVRKSLERRQLVEKEITSKIKISDQDIVSHYLSNNNGQSSQVFEFQLAHVLLKKSDTELAERLYSEIKRKSNFPVLVKKHSVDDESKSKGGEFGNFKSGEMIGVMESAVASLDIGEISKPVATEMGIHIFKILDKKLVKDPAIEKQKIQIRQYLFSKAFKEQLEFWLSQKRKEAIIQIN